MTTRASSAPRSTGDPATAILVLGMHRSGTSAITRLLNLRGADLGRDLLPARADNELGFWENREILDLHERLLADQGLRWLDPVHRSDGWAQGEAERRFVAALPDVLRRQFGASRLFVVKDPRLSLVAPLWIEALAGMNVRPAFVITVRHPDEVAASLARRDGLPSIQSQLLWLQHFVEAERATRGQARVFVHYERLLEDWRKELARIGNQLKIDWPNVDERFDAEAARFVAPAQRHHRGGEAVLPPLIRRVYELACNAAADRSVPRGDFERAAAACDELMQVTAPLYAVLSRHQADSDVRHAAEIADARANIDSLAAELAQARDAHAERDRLEAELRESQRALEAEIARAREVHALKESELDAARAHIDALGRDIARAREVVAAKDREIDAARATVDALTSELGRARESSEALAAQIDRKQEEIDAARRNVDALLADVDRARSAHARKEQEIDAARSNIDALIAEIAAARGNIDGLVAQIEQARRSHELRDATEAALRGDLQALRQSRWFRLGRSLRLIGGSDQ